MARANHFGLMLRYGLLGVAFLGLAFSQTQWSRDSASITDPRPLLKAAEVLTARYGVPISYEDMSAYNYYADLADPVDYRATHPTARILPPKGGSLNFKLEPLSMTPYPVPLADTADVAKLLSGVLAQHASNGNPGRFIVLKTAGGLVIVPAATRDASGSFVPDHSLLDTRISFSEVSGRSGTVLGVFRDALLAASGKAVHIDEIMRILDPVRADNEPARDVLIRMLQGSHEVFGLEATDGTAPRVRSWAWELTTERGIDASVETSYHLRIRPAFGAPTDPQGKSIR